MPSPASQPDGERLQLLEPHTIELEEIVWTIAASFRYVFWVKESEILEANKNIRKINNLSVEECPLKPMILYEKHPQKDGTSD